MDLPDPEPDVRTSQIDRYEFHPTSTSSHHLRLSIAVIFTILHFTPIIIRNPHNPNTIIFAQPYITKWLMVPYAAYYTRTSKSLLTGQPWVGPLPKVPLIRATADDSLIREPRTVIRNLRVGLLTYWLCGAVMIWDVSYMWATHLLPKLWNNLPPYAVGQWRLELLYSVVGVLILVTLILGPVLLLVVVCGSWVELSKDAKIVKRFCMEKIEMEKIEQERERKGKKKP